MNFLFFFFYRKVESSRLPSAKTQDEQKAPDAVHHIPAAGPGEEVPSETVSVHRRARRVLQLPQLNGDPGQNLVSEQEGESQAATRGRAGKTENGSQAHAATSFRDFLSTRRTRPRVLRSFAPVPEALAAGFSCGTVRGPRRIQYVPLGLTRTHAEYFLFWQPRSEVRERTDRWVRRLSAVTWLDVAPGLRARTLRVLFQDPEVYPLHASKFTLCKTNNPALRVIYS